VTQPGIELRLFDLEHGWANYGFICAAHGHSCTVIKFAPSPDSFPNEEGTPLPILHPIFSWRLFFLDVPLNVVFYSLTVSPPSHLPFGVQE